VVYGVPVGDFAGRQRLPFSLAWWSFTFPLLRAAGPAGIHADEVARLTPVAESQRPAPA
jgi:hypothetical protein